jgi:hypothetical protein
MPARTNLSLTVGPGTLGRFPAPDTTSGAQGGQCKMPNNYSSRIISKDSAPSSGAARWSSGCRRPVSRAELGRPTRHTVCARPAQRQCAWRSARAPNDTRRAPTRHWLTGRPNKLSTATKKHLSPRSALRVLPAPINTARKISRCNAINVSSPLRKSIRV